MVAAHLKIFFSELVFNQAAHGCYSFCRKIHRVGTHVGDMTVLIELLSYGHSERNGETELARSLLLESGSGKRRSRRLRYGVNINITYLESGIFAGVEKHEGVGLRLEALRQLCPYGMSFIAFGYEYGCDTVIRF